MAEGFQVIARRWRPQQFDEIVGQEHIVRTLKNAIETGRIGHAYLFVGPRGTGKTTTARIFAKALNCTNGPCVAPPEDDPICRAIVAGACPDVTEIDAATNRSVDDAKQIREECYYPPMQCRYKIYIIDEVHQLSKDAFNALLKVIEEPPEFVKFIFATTESDKVLETITSRCQRFEFQPIPEEKIAARLRKITENDGVEADEDALLAIARLANGGMRDSQSILDQVISFCGKKIAERDVSDIYGLASKQEIEGLASAMARADYAAVVGFADKFVEEGRDLLRVLAHTQVRVRDALLDSIRGNGKSALLGATMRTEQLLRMLDALNAGEGGVKFGLSERANFEVTLLKAVEQSRTRAIDSLIKEISSLAESVPAGDEKKNKLTAKCEAALAEAAAVADVPAPSVPAARKEVSEKAPAPVPAEKKTPPRTPASPKKSVPVPAPVPAPADDDFAAQYANFDEASVASFAQESVPADVSPRAVPAPASVAKKDSAALKAAIESVPAAIRDFVAEHFQGRFDHVIPADEAHVFSPREETEEDAGKSAAAPENSEENSDSASED